MVCRSISINCLICCLYLHLGSFRTLADVQLKLSNDGPAILDSEITFYALLKGVIPEGDYEYVFEDNTGSPEKTHTIQAGLSANLTLRVNSGVYKESIYTMKVTVYKKVFKIIPQMVAAGKMSFMLTEGINGNILVEENDKADYIPVGQVLNFTFKLYDPSHYFDGASFAYIWKFNQTTFLDLNETALFNVSQPGNLLVSLSLFAKIDRSNGTAFVIKSGSIDQNCRAVVPINNLTVHGNIWLKRGEVLVLDVSCNGTSPYRYCAQVLENGTDPCGGQDPVTSTQCSFHVMHYFRNAGKYKVGLMVKNNLNVVNRTVDIQIYDVDKKPQLSTIIYPIASCCLGIVIVVIGVAYHLQQRRTYTIEVADFDFQEPVMLIEKSFVARLRDSIRDALDGYQQTARTTPSKLVVNGSSRTTPIPSRYVPIS